MQVSTKKKLNTSEDNLQVIARIKDFFFFFFFGHNVLEKIILIIEKRRIAQEKKQNDAFS